METKILDGTTTSKVIREQIKERIAKLNANGVSVTLAAVLVGDDPASHTYVKMKTRQCEAVGIGSQTYILPASATQEEVETLVKRLSDDPDVTGILVQHPLPKGLDEYSVLAAISPAKDIDGISPFSLGALVANKVAFEAATPKGIIALLEHYQLPIEGQRVVIIGRSVILGKPLALMMMNRHATVTVCHTRTKDIKAISREADILVVAAGRPELVNAEWIKPGAVVIDAGYNKVEGRQGDVGDVDYESAKQVASWITPVPGGVGPMTIAMLLTNTTDAAEQKTI
ncbi:MAG: bifunctional 5,10-methylenetetrahydrofolate dehydrogenase/5,10-methenyltetrahydrofolate cyclohydrolase [bacterium]